MCNVCDANRVLEAGAEGLTFRGPILVDADGTPTKSILANQPIPEDDDQVIYPEGNPALVVRAEADGADGAEGPGKVWVRWANAPDGEWHGPLVTDDLASVMSFLGTDMSWQHVHRTIPAHFALGKVTGAELMADWTEDRDEGTPRGPKDIQTIWPVLSEHLITTPALSITVRQHRNIHRPKQGIEVEVDTKNHVLGYEARVTVHARPDPCGTWAEEDDFDEKHLQVAIKALRDTADVLEAYHLTFDRTPEPG